MTSWDDVNLDAALVNGTESATVSMPAAKPAKSVATDPALQIAVRYEATDGVKVSKTFKAVAAASKFARKYIGDHPEMGMGYAIAADGVGKVSVTGCELAELFPAPATVESNEGGDMGGTGELPAEQAPAKGKTKKAAAVPAGMGEAKWSAVVEAVRDACGLAGHLVAVPGLLNDSNRHEAVVQLQELGYAMPTTLRGAKSAGYVWTEAGADNVGMKATRKAGKVLGVEWFEEPKDKAPAKVKPAAKATAVKTKAKPAPAPVVEAPAKAKAPSAKEAAMASAQAGVLPAVPEFGEIGAYKPYKTMLANVVALVEAGDIAGLEAFEIKPTCTGPKKVMRYRDLAVAALKSRAELEKADAKHATL